MNPLHTLDDLRKTYRLFVETFQDIQNDKIRAWLHERIEEGNFLWRPPFVTLRRRFKPGESLASLVGSGLLHAQIPAIFRKEPAKADSAPISPYQHQADAWKILIGSKHNCVVTTGTGSGKSFCFAVPVVDACLRANTGAGFMAQQRRGVKALLVYPMNALANSQYDDLAQRLSGSGLTICKYTGELKDDPEAAKKSFIEGMGREPFDSEVISRDDLRNGRGADILVTNFVMLELILTRFDDRNIFPFGSLTNLQYLVFDEIHTYTGRQGADVACLIRRLKEHTQVKGKVRCVGTSATIDSGDPDKARGAIAQFARDLFGESFLKEDVVSESYGSFLTDETPAALPSPGITMEMVDNASNGDDIAVQKLRDVLCGKPGATGADLRKQASVHFIERRMVPITAGTPGGALIQRWDELVRLYRTELRPKLSEADAALELAGALVVATKTPVPTGDGADYPLLLPKVHSFFSQGQPLTACLGYTDTHLSGSGEKVCAKCTEGLGHGEEPVKAYPLLFCAACGKEALTAELRDDNGIEFLMPRDQDYTECEGKPVYVFPEHWDSVEIPPDDAAIKKDGTARKNKEGAVPNNHSVCTICGVLDNNCKHNSLKPVALVYEPLLMCPCCGVIYDGRVREFNKFFAAGMAGRATATNVIVSRLLEQVPATPKRRVIAFTDNIQDAAFQSGHTTDWGRRLHFRRALFRGLLDSGHVTHDQAIELPNAGGIAFDAMKEADRVPIYAKTTTVQVGNAARTGEATYKKYLAFGAIGEITARPYKRQPTLEMSGLLSVTYDGIQDVAEKNEYWTNIPVLVNAPVPLRLDVLQIFLDLFRRAGAIDTESLNHGEDFEDKVINRIMEDAQFHSDTLPPFWPCVFSDEMPSDNRDYSVRRIAGVPGTTHAPILLRWLRKQFDLPRPAAEQIARGMTQMLADEKVGLLNMEGGPGQRRYQIPEGRILLYARKSETGWVCPRCRLRWDVSQELACPSCIKTTLREDSLTESYYRTEYETPLKDRQQMLAVEHTSRLTGEERRSYEQRFDKKPDDPLNVMVCTPTMELGVDITGLSAVYLRNVPPSPANYAQRQGRAGRHGQAAIVATFCGTQGRYTSHDQYFFRYPERIIAGNIAPPKFLLENRVLLEAHLHALVLQIADVKVRRYPKEFLRIATDADVKANLPMIDGVLEEIRQKVANSKLQIIQAAKGAFGEELKVVHFTDSELEKLVDDFDDEFDHAFDRFRDEYCALQEEGHELHVRSMNQKTTREDDIRYRAVRDRMSDMRDGNGDFYTYRYLGNVGFLPNYAFPRRASQVYFTDSRESISRHPAIAIREFAPLTTVYFRRQRYQIVRSQPRARGQAHNWSKLKVCGCGNYFLNDDVAQAAACPVCSANLMGTHTDEHVLDLPDMVARRVSRISADEEERSRRGFHVNPYFRTGPQVTPFELESSVSKLAGVRYVRRGKLLLVNEGARASDDRGFWFCEKCRAWLASQDSADDHVDQNSVSKCPAGADINDIHPEVLLYYEGNHDYVLIEASAPAGVKADEYGWSLLYAISNGFQVAFSADESEVGCHLYTTLSDPQKVRLLLYEQDEGGSGLISNLLSADGWQRMAKRALEILHVDPATGLEVPGACERACYDCLQSFYNQQQHYLLNRSLAIPFLKQLLEVQPFVAAKTDDKSIWAELKKNAIGAEPQIIDALENRHFPPPEAQHEIIRDHDGVAVAEADLLYAGKIVVWVQGGPHHSEHVAKRDAAQKKTLKGLGYRVVEIWPEKQDEGLKDLAQKLERPDLM